MKLCNFCTLIFMVLYLIPHSSELIYLTLEWATSFTHVTDIN